MKIKTMASFVDSWLSKKPEYIDSIPIDQCVKAARDEVPMGLVDQAIVAQLRGAFVDRARARGMKATQRKAKNGSSVYSYTAQLALFDFIEFVRTQRSEIAADISSLRREIAAWVEAHPAEGLSEEDIWEQSAPVVGLTGTDN